MNEIQKKIINTQRSFRFLIYKKTYSRFNLIKIVKRNEEIRENVERGERLIKMDVQEQVPDSEDGPQNAKKWVNELGISSHGHRVSGQLTTGKKTSDNFRNHMQE